MIVSIQVGDIIKLPNGGVREVTEIRGDILSVTGDVWPAALPVAWVEKNCMAVYRKVEECV